MAKGHPKVGGRQKGTPNKSTLGIIEKLAAWKCDPFKTLQMMADNTMPCSVCRGSGMTKFQPGAGSERFSGQRTCQSCWGSKMERISPKERGWAAGELAQYVAAKRKAVEVSGPEGTTLPITVNVVYRKPEETSQ